MLNRKKLQSPVHALMVTALVLFGGCRSAPSSRIPVLDSFSPDGGGGPTPDQVESLEQGPGNGAVIRFEAGDEIVLEVQVSGDVVRGGNDTSLSFIVGQPVDAWMGPDGVRLRAEDGPWLKPLDFFTGSLTTGFSLGAEDRINRATMSIEADRR